MSAAPQASSAAPDPNDSHRASGHPLGQTVTKRYENPA